MKSSTERVAKLRAAAKKKGYVRREYYATPNEHEYIKTELANMRSGKQ